jgi:hypothetical protein
VRLVGIDQVARYLQTDRDLQASTALRAWVLELKTANWPDAAHLQNQFRQVDASNTPKVIFRLAAAPIGVETLIHFGSGVVLITEIQRLSS